MVEGNRKRKGRTILEIGIGPATKLDAGIELNPGDKYIAADVSQPVKHKPGELSLASLLRCMGAKFSRVRADGLSLPLKPSTVDHVVMNNVLSEPTFPNASLLVWKRKQRISFRQAVEKLEAELHRVTKPNATVALQHHYLAQVLDAPRFRFFGKTRLQEIQEVFSPRWGVKVKRGTAWAALKGKPFETTTMHITMRKK